MLSLAAETALAQGFQTTVPTNIMTQFRNQRILWTTNVWVYANGLFGILALIEFTWSAATMVLDKTDLQSWTSALIRKIMWIGAFYALLINGRNWIPAIIDSFEQIGYSAAGMGRPLSPSDVMAQGINIAGALMDSAGSSGFFTNPGPAFALVFCAIIIVLSYVIITINFVVVMVESYIIVSVGFLFLGFGGSRWTAPYVERYIGLAVSIGIKIVLIYCLISAGFNLGVGWATEATTVGASPNPALVAFDVMGGAVIFMMLCWQIPKLFGAVLGGARALTGGDLITTGTALAAGTFAVGSLGAGAVASAASTVAGTTSAAKIDADTATAAKTASEVSSATSAGNNRGGSVPPPGPSGPTPNGTGPKNSPPPGRGPGSGGAAVDPAEVSSGAGNGNSVRPPHDGKGSTTAEEILAELGAEALSGSGFEREGPGKGFVAESVDLGSSGSTSGAAPAAAENAPASAAPSSGQATRARSSPQAGNFSSTAHQTSRNLQGAANRVRYIGRRIALDSAPPVSPPRMPVEHEE